MSRHRIRFTVHTFVIFLIETRLRRGYKVAANLYGLTRPTPPPRWWDSSFPSMSRLCKNYFQLDLMSSDVWKECVSRDINSFLSFSVTFRFGWLESYKQYQKSWQTNSCGLWIWIYVSLCVRWKELSHHEAFSDNSNESDAKHFFRPFIEFETREKWKLALPHRRLSAMCFLSKIAHFQSAFPRFLAPHTQQAHELLSMLRRLQVLLNCDHIK